MAFCLGLKIVKDIVVQWWYDIDRETGTKRISLFLCHQIIREGIK